MAESRILIRLQGNQGFIKIIGQGTFQNAGSLKGAYLDMLAKNVTEFTIDLSECELLDSTHIGILLGLGLKVKDEPFSKAHVLKANETISELFRSVGLDRLFIFDK